MESALVIGSLLPDRSDAWTACYSFVHKMIEDGDLDSNYMSHYIEAYSTWDMNKMIEIIYSGKRLYPFCLSFRLKRTTTSLRICFSSVTAQEKD